MNGCRLYFEMVRRDATPDRKLSDHIFILSIALGETNEKVSKFARHKWKEYEMRKELSNNKCKFFSHIGDMPSLFRTFSNAYSYGYIFSSHLS